MKVLAGIVEHRFHRFIFIFRAAENALGLFGVEIEAIEERMVAFVAMRPRPLAESSDAALHQQGFSTAASASTTSAAASAGHATLHRSAGIFIAILRIAAPDQLRLRARFDFEGPQQMRDAACSATSAKSFPN